MLIIGLTGSIATGKSTVSSTLSSPPYSLPVIDADVLARKVVEPGTRGYSRIVAHFFPTTPDLLVPASDSMPEAGPTGRGRPLNRAMLGRRVFGSGEDKQRDRSVLNRIVHPAVRLEICKAIFWNFVAGHWAVVLDVPLLYESSLSVICGAVVVVAVRDPEVQLRRLADRDGAGLSREDAVDRIGSQEDVRVKAQRCHDLGSGRGLVLWNDGSRDDLEAAVGEAVAQLRSRRPAWWTWLLLGFPVLAVAMGLRAVWQNWRANKAWDMRDATKPKSA